MKLSLFPKKINWTYAIGEIIIVIIGITIAFSLNRWAETAENRKTKGRFPFQENSPSNVDCWHFGDIMSTPQIE